jgi:hypothetical protein
MKYLRNKGIRILFGLLLILTWQTLKAQSTERIEGRIVWNLTEIEGFYGLEDSLVQIIIDTLEKVRIVFKDSIEIMEGFKEYDLIQENGLLYNPCKFIKSAEGKKIRIYFNKKDYDQVLETNWFNKIKEEKLHTFVTMEARKNFERTYICERIIEINQRRLPDD